MPTTITRQHAQEHALAQFAQDALGAFLVGAVHGRQRRLHGLARERRAAFAVQFDGQMRPRLHQLRGVPRTARDRGQR
jgi:hypothetical protein